MCWIVPPGVKLRSVFRKHQVQNTANALVLLAAAITLVTALVPFGKWAWRTYGIRNFDAKKAHYSELVENAKWYEDRLVRLDTLRKQLIIRQGIRPAAGQVQTG
jgi:hypothetical protein